MYRKGVSALIVNKNNEILVVNLISFENHFYAIPGGGVEADETLIETVYREIDEELGIKKESLVFVGESKIPLMFTFKQPKVDNQGKEYVGSERYFFGFSFVGADEDVVLNENEVRAYKWVKTTDLKNYLLFDNQLDETMPKIFEIFPGLL